MHKVSGVSGGKGIAATEGYCCYLRIFRGYAETGPASGGDDGSVLCSAPGLKGNTAPAELVGEQLFRRCGQCVSAFTGGQHRNAEHDFCLNDCRGVENSAGTCRKPIHD